MTQAHALLLLGGALCIVAGMIVATAAANYTTARRAWRADARALGQPGYDARASDAHYELAEHALTRVKTASHALGASLLLALTGFFGRTGAKQTTAGATTSVSPARALAVVWLDTSICLVLLALNFALMPRGARLANAILGAVVPWLMAALLTAPVAAGFTLAGLLLGTRLRDDAGERPSPLRALLTLPLLPLTLLSAIPALPAHLLLLGLRRHPGSARITLH
ncbi:MAG: hypothetical protein GXP55_09065, partial [Deltaproteobacteria bacterium]|nr:hypothetical protein [Deltaproteobacteria bacterium]